MWCAGKWMEPRICTLTVDSSIFVSIDTHLRLSRVLKCMGIGSSSSSNNICASTIIPNSISREPAIDANDSNNLRDADACSTLQASAAHGLAPDCIMLQLDHVYSTYEYGRSSMVQ
jgi:hypothetical protein